MNSQNQIKKSLTILNSKNKKSITKQIIEQWGDCFPKDDFVFLLSTKDRIYLAKRDFENLDMNLLRIDHLGMYFGTQENSGIRLSIEGSQLIGPSAKKNIFKINEEQLKTWLLGNNIILNSNELINYDSNYILIQYKNDFIGCGKRSGENKSILTNFIPKARRVISELIL